MDDNLENNDWKKEAPMLAGLPLRNPFSVPEGYFEDLPLKVSNSVYVEKLKAEGTQTGFHTPENYFKELNENINSEILKEKIKSAVPEEGYIIPVNYFEQLKSNILDKTVNETKQPAKVVRLWRSSILKYASAACFLILSTIGFYFYQQQQQNSSKIAYSDLATEQMLYDIDEQVIIDHIQANDLQQAKPSATEVELENYILNNYTQSDIASNL
jgi:hypothetical protein